MKDLSAYKKQFDRRLTAFFNSRLKTYHGIGKETLVPDYIDQAQRIALAGGKRFRPYLATLAYETFGGKTSKDITAAGLAIEIFHLFALIHDDIMDQGSFRHGLPTTHTYVLKSLQSKKRIGDLVRTADSQAILVGDLALAWSMELMTLADRVGGKMRPLALEAFYKTLDEVVVGQMIEVDVTTRQAITLEELEHKHLYKSARYSFVGPIRIGARLATHSTNRDGFAERFGAALGMGFQIQDDLLDVASDSTKGILTDLVQRQHTYLTYYVLERAQSKYKKFLLQHFGRPDVAVDAKKIVEMYQASGAVAFAQAEAKKRFSQARHLLANGPVPKAYQAYWQAIIDIIEVRKS